MDTTKFRKSIEDSKLSEETKNVIYTALEDADNLESWDTIIEALDYEGQMSQMIADEAKELLNLAETQEKMTDAVEDQADKETKELEVEVDSQVDDYMAKPEEEAQEPVEPVDLASSPADETSKVPEEKPTEEPVEPVPSWSQPVVETAPGEQPVQAAEPAPVPQWEQLSEQPAQPAPVSLGEQPAQPVQPVITPQWDQLAEQPAQSVQPAQPAPFPGSQTGTM